LDSCFKYVNTARQRLAGAGTQTAGLAFGGQPVPVGQSTEEFNSPGFTIKTLTTT
jgi:hypothetical protein